MPYKRTGRPPGRPKNQPPWARIERAKKALADKAEAAVKILETAAKVAASKGNHAPVAWMLEHMSAVDSEGKEVRPISSGIDRQSIEGGSRGTTINVGWVSSTSPALPAVTVRELPPAESEDS